MRNLLIGASGGFVLFVLWFSLKVIRDLSTIHAAFEVQGRINEINNTCGIRTEAKLDKALKAWEQSQMDNKRLGPNIVHRPGDPIPRIKWDDPK